MSRYPDLAHCVTALINVPAAKAFEFLADPLALGTWSLGCMRTRSAAGGPYSGTSLYDDSPASFDVRPHPELLLIDYLVGDAGNLKPRHSVRVIAADTCDLVPNQCYVSLMAWRPAGMADDRWAQLRAAHDAEIWIIKARIEGPG
ncbi:MAG TPA: hypothetical protein VGC34_08410, partial [Steroidobacteraceae bacterium]